jgi:hypothetical protein
MIGRAKSAATRLSECLEAERRAILSGDLGRLDEFAATKERLIPRLVSEDVDPEELEELRRRVRGNARLLEAAARGLRSVLDQIGSLKDGGPALTSYSDTGQKQDLGRKKSSVERRA